MAMERSLRVSTEEVPGRAEGPSGAVVAGVEPEADVPAAWRAAGRAPGGTAELDPPGIVWAAVATNGAMHFTIGEGADDDRYVYRYSGGSFKKLFACPDFTGSYLSFDGNNLYLSQWYEKRILKLDQEGTIVRKIDIGAEICGHTFVDGIIYVLRGIEKPNEDWRIARLDPREETPEIKDLAVVPFACRSLTFDGENFWSNYRAANETVCFSLPS